MCGICGIVDFGPGRVEKPVIRRMTDSIRHRGPDDEGVFTTDEVGLGHRRLSIIDLSPTGHQPMVAANGRWTLVYNGELYNFESLRSRLEADGQRFRGSSDSEVLLESFARWGVDALPMLDGMFGFAIWDSQKHELHLARDRFGIKPLYYRPTPNGIVFGSEIKAILAADPNMPREINHAALHEHMYFGNALGRNTLFQGIERLEPGHRLVVSRDKCQVHAYWRVSDVPQVEVDENEAVEEVRRRLDETVRQHLVSDVPVGVFLSGGIDSSAITALASKHYGGALKTFSVEFDFEKGVNELDKARIVAKRFQTDHREIQVRAENLPQVIEKLIRSHDEPFADAAHIPLYLLCEQLESEVKVILQGDGGDEIFAGYRRYNVLSADSWWRALAKFVVLADPIRPKNLLAQPMRFFRLMAHPDPAVRAALYMTLSTLENPPTRALSADWRAALASVDPFARYRQVYRSIAHLDPVQRMLYTDTQIILPDTFLEKVDKSTMAHSIEVRVPLLGTELTRYVMSLSSKLKVRRGQKKFILRKALRGLVPDEILDGPKTGFSVPVGYWMRGPMNEYLRSVLLDESARRSGLFDSIEVERMIDEHVAGHDRASLLYRILNLALWHREYLT